LDVSLGIALGDVLDWENGSPPKARKKFDQNRSHLYRLVHIYTDYVKRLWVDTNPENRKRIANDKAATLIRQVQKIVKEDDYIEFSDVSDEAREQLVTAFDTWLKAVSKSTSAPADTAEAITSLDNSAISALDTSVVAGEVTAGDIESKSAVAKSEPKKKQRSVMFGAAIGLAVAGWVRFECHAGMLGAWVQKWPLWALTGAVHGAAYWASSVNRAI
jgi:hypothetical protein